VKSRRWWLVVAFGALALAAAVAWWKVSQPPPDDYPAGQAGPEVIIAVQEGDPLSKIGQALIDQGVIKTNVAFLRAVQANEQSRFIQPGGHRVETNIPASLAIEQLLDRSRLSGLVTLFEGIRSSQVVDRLDAFGLPRSEIEQALKSVELPIPQAKSAEGFLLPGQYAFVPTTTAEQAITTMLKRFTASAEKSGLLESAERLGLTEYQGLIVASLLQAEADPEDFDKVLRVILNRLKIGMPLQLDATVLYALNRFGDVRVTNKDLTVDSPFNTYKYNGLPPAPINNPGTVALQALASPADGDWLYYITVKPGDTRFTRSYDQLLEWKVEFRRNYRDGLFN
jgi:UPF0755 protein